MLNLKGVSSFLCILIVFILLASCSTAGPFGWFKFWDSPPVSSELTDNDVTKFVSTIRPTRGNPDSHYLLARYYQKKGMHKEAIEEFRKIIAIDPRYKKAYNGIGVSFDHLGNFLKANESYQTALSIDPKLDYALNNLGYSYLKQGNYEAAVTALEQAAALNNHDKRIRGNLGLAYDLSGEHEKALESFESIGNEANAYYREAQGPNLTSSESNAYQPVNKNKEDGTSKIDSQKEALKLIISQLTSERKNKEMVVNISKCNDIKGDNLSQNEKVNRDSSLKKFGIEISNGNGIHRMAKRIGKYLNEKGYHVVRLTNASSFNYPKTVISYHEDYVNEARGVEQQIPGSHAMEKVVKLERPHIMIRVLIGKDIVKYNDIFSES